MEPAITPPPHSMPPSSIAVPTPRFIIPPNFFLPASDARNQPTTSTTGSVSSSLNSTATAVAAHRVIGRTQRVAQGYPPSTCAICGKSFLTEKYLQMHMGLHLIASDSFVDAGDETEWARAESGSNRIGGGVGAVLKVEDVQSLPRRSEGGGTSLVDVPLRAGAGRTKTRKVE